MQGRGKESAKKCGREVERLALMMVRIMESDGGDDAGDVRKAEYWGSAVDADDADKVGDELLHFRETRWPKRRVFPGQTPAGSYLAGE